ncbi:MAG: alpha/beta fold hydrolase [Bacteroidota bacterium]|nr:alpha/beta fold hydrolase [Bacteroidota bacterium]
MHKSFILLNRHRDRIFGDIHLPETAHNAPVIVICHGFKGFKGWGGFPWAAEHFALKGFVAVRFNFSLNGVEEEFGQFTALDRFARNTISRELDDLADIIDAISAGSLTEEPLDDGRIAVLGHSLGGGVAVVHASEDARIRAAVAWAGVADFDRWGKKTKEQWRREGRLEIQNARTGQLMPMNVDMLDDLEANAGRFDIPAAVARLEVPLLVVHGEQDVSVPIAEGERNAASARTKGSALVRIPNADHTFGVTHPFEGPTAAFRDVVEKTSAWLWKVLS